MENPTASSPDTEDLPQYALPTPAHAYCPYFPTVSAPLHVDTAPTITYLPCHSLIHSLRRFNERLLFINYWKLHGMQRFLRPSLCP